MAILQGILKESRDYYGDLDRRLKARLKALAPGSILKRRIGRGIYYYQVFRKGKKVVSRYLGKSAPARIVEEIAERKIIKRQIREVAVNLRTLDRLKERKRRGRSVSKEVAGVG